MMPLLSPPRFAAAAQLGGALTIAGLLCGCLTDRDFGGFGDDGTGTTSAGTIATGSGLATAGSDGISASGPGDDADDGWPPGFDPVPDIGDGTLSENMLVVVSTSEGPLYLFGYFERLGDTFQGRLGGASFDGTTWRASASMPRDRTSSLANNEVSAAFEEIIIPDGQHPFGAGDVTVDIALNARLYADELLCGRLDIDFSTGGGSNDNLFVAVPVTVIGAVAQPVVSCQ